MEMLNEALKRRKGRGVDIAIVLGGDQPLNMSTPEVGEKDEEAEVEELGIAPDVKEEGADVHEDEAMDKELIMEMLGKNSLLSRNKK